MSNNPVFAPLSSKMNLVTIVLVAVAFVAFRLSGGGFQIRSLPVKNGTGVKQVAIPKDEDLPSDVDAAELSDEQEESPGTAPAHANTVAAAPRQKELGVRASSGSVDPLDALLKRDKGDEVSAQQSPKDGDKGGLAEIERKLGLR